MRAARFVLFDTSEKSVHATGIKTPADHWTDIQADRGGVSLAGIAGSNLAWGIALSLL
jgi:hypothetical protein